MPQQQGVNVLSIKRLHTNRRMSQAVVCNGMVFLAGQVAPTKAGGSVAEQTGDILARIDELLKEAGTDKTKLLSANIWLTDIGTFNEMNEVWDAWLPEGGAPARATVEARLAAPQFKVEIAVVAAL
jgi:enamine deaminase RidA (YjgF/YER057c/UK114 family)